MAFEMSELVDALLNSTVLLSIGALTLLGYWFYTQWVTFRSYPAGPWGLPVVGYLPFLGPKAYQTLVELGHKYGNVFSIRLGEIVAIVFNDWDAIKAALVQQSDNFSGRPRIFVFDSLLHKKDIATNYGPLWKEQRRFTVQGLKPFSAGKMIRESIVMDSIGQLMQHFETNNGKVIEMHRVFFPTIMNIVWRMVCGQLIPTDDERSIRFCKIARGNITGLRNNSPLNFLPWLRFVMPGGCGHWKHVDYHKQLMDYLETEVQEHLRTIKEGENRDFLDAYLNEIKRLEVIKKTQEPPYNKEHLMGTLFDLFLGGIETSFNTLSWGFLYLALWPQVQRKAQSELDEVIGMSRFPMLEDQPKLPYLEATIMEVHRFCSLMPFSFLHSSLNSTEVLGHKIPKGATIIENLYAVHHDPKLWGDPENFRPERFLDAEGHVIKPEYLIPFSTGARLCFGEAIAKIQLFLIFSCVLQRFTFQVPPNTPRPSLDPNVSLTLIPQPYSLLVQSRC